MSTQRNDGDERKKLCTEIQIETTVIDKNRSRVGIIAGWKKSEGMDGKMKGREADERDRSAEI